MDVALSRLCPPLLAVNVYVDFSVRSPDAEVYVAALRDFPEPPSVGSTFIGTDHDEFTVECRVLRVDEAEGRVYHRPISGLSPA